MARNQTCESRSSRATFAAPSRARLRRRLVVLLSALFVSVWALSVHYWCYYLSDSLAVGVAHGHIDCSLLRYPDNADAADRAGRCPFDPTLLHPAAYFRPREVRRLEAADCSGIRWGRMTATGLLVDNMGLDWPSWRIDTSPVLLKTTYEVNHAMLGPYKTYSLIVPFWIPSAALGAFAVWSFATRRVASPLHCRSCGYLLLGNISGICPECGQPVAAEQFDEQEARDETHRD